MNFNNDKMMADLHRLLAEQNFQSEDELRKFMEGMTGKPIPFPPLAKLSPKERAMELLYSAHNDGSEDAVMLSIAAALELDPDCIEAYFLLGEMAEIPQIAIAFYGHGVTIGRKEFGGKYLEENKGYFWGLHETRGFMRCLYSYALCLDDIGKREEAMEIMEELLELNLNDNQGVRDPFMLYLIDLDKKQKFKKFDKQFHDDGSAFAHFNRALFAFKTGGETDEANKLLAEAVEVNRNVVPLLRSNREVMEIPEMYSPGDKREAEYYAFYAQDVWRNTKGAIDWLKKHSAGKKK